MNNNSSFTLTINPLLILQKYEDPRTKQWLLVSSPLPTILCCFLYVVGVMVVGPHLMQNKKPFQLRKVLIWYNFLQLALSTWLFYEFCASGWLTDYSYRCQPIDYSTNPKTMRMNRATWWFFFSKFTELFETIFFVMRKKNSQVNLLHVYHHGIMPISSWLAIKYYPNGHGTFPGLLNTFVHMLMYSYYLLSSFGPEMQKFLWWKKYLTTLQIVQFVVIMAHALQVIFIDCNFPKIFLWFMTLLALSFYFLFNRFYHKTYTKNKKN